MTSDSVSQYIPTTGIRLHTVLAGPEDGEPVFLLHGFPDAWFGWKAQINALADVGFRVVVPDQRGYNLSDKPSGIAPFPDNYAALSTAIATLSLPTHSRCRGELRTAPTIYRSVKNREWEKAGDWERIDTRRHISMLAASHGCRDRCSSQIFR